VSQTIGSRVTVRWDRRDRLNRRQTEKDLTQIVRLLLEVRPAWDHAVEGGVYSPRKESGRPSTHSETDPTYAAVVTPTQAQLRRVARQAAQEIAEARARLEMAADLLARGLLRTDPEVYRRDLEKRQAATQRR
jgi:hypothetical protein